MNDWNAGRIMVALARRFDWWQNLMMPEWAIGTSRADLVFVTKSGYLTEIEIKVSMSDWNADALKRKGDRSKVARFFYAAPLELAERAPAWIHQDAGILGIYPNRGYDSVRTVREARRSRARRIDEREIAEMYKSCYYRYWRSELSRRRLATHPVGISSEVTL